MHIDVGIKANQAGRHHPHHPPPALPPRRILFVPVLKRECQTCPADRPSDTMMMVELLLKLGPTPDPDVLPPDIHRHRLHPAAAAAPHTGFKINAPLEQRSPRTPPRTVRPGGNTPYLLHFSQRSPAPPPSPALPPASRNEAAWLRHCVWREY